MVLLSVVEKVSGCSAKVFNVSNSNLAGMQILPVTLLSTSILEEIVVSKSDAEMLSSLLSKDNKKLSKIGMVLLLLIIPPNTCKCFSKYVLETINFMNSYFILNNRLTIFC